MCQTFTIMTRTARALLLLHVVRVFCLPQGYPSADYELSSSYPLDPEQYPEQYDSREDIYDSFELGWNGDDYSAPDEESYAVPDDLLPEEEPDPAPTDFSDSYEGLKDFIDNYFALAKIYQGLDEEGKAEFVQKLEETDVDSPIVDSRVYHRRQAPERFEKQIIKTPLATTTSQLRRFLRLFRKYRGRAQDPEDGMSSYVDYMTQWQDQLSTFDEATQGAIVDLLAAGEPLPSDAALGLPPRPARGPLPSVLRPKSNGKLPQLYRLPQLWESLDESSRAAILASIAPTRLARRQEPPEDPSLIEIDVGAPAETTASESTAAQPTAAKPPAEETLGPETIEPTPTTDDGPGPDVPTVTVTVTILPEDLPVTGEPTVEVSTIPDATVTVPAEATPVFEPPPEDPTTESVVDPAPTDPVLVDPIPVETSLLEPTLEAPITGATATDPAAQTPVKEAPVEETPLTEPAVESPPVDVPAAETSVTEPAVETPVEETTTLVEESTVETLIVEPTPIVEPPIVEPTLPPTSDEEPPVVGPTLEPTSSEEFPVVVPTEVVVEPTLEPTAIVEPPISETTTSTPPPVSTSSPVSTTPPSQSANPTTLGPTTSAPTTSTQNPPPRYIKATVAGRARGQLRPTPIPGLPAVVNTWPDWALPLAYDWPAWAARFGRWPDWMPWDYPRGGPGWRRLKADLKDFVLGRE
ncbi:uncharacterized protein EI97DRAFT_485629 [Westerdykella ornata]|uniref:Opioid growth factor receptor (OGFr) conserved domain-containing protein n=1 Tax=Westerdykella ornata TaxID=318751 RepID=A0A6A6J8I1_WESOR|nr:uncharacterized protein EI97DRAFT_485629 [Westerdykella ornata]KAF2271946.1 hypothetical protein EI97DRAFT_485629 [Westerdykella ornata]